jgi:serine/threonine-protein kinase RsbT
MNNYRIQVADESGIAEAARCARRVASSVGLNKVQVGYVTTAASELAANLFFHAGGGVFEARALIDRPGLELLATDQGPGIADLELAMRDGYSTTGSLGCGLPGVKRLMDEMEIVSQPNHGTRVRACKWL